MELMTWEELKYLASLGHEIGAHSMTHPHLSECTPSTVNYEVNESKKQLEQVLGDRVQSFAYPYGDLPANYRSVMQDAGYACAVAMESDAPTIASDPYRIGRSVVGYGETPLTLAAKLPEPLG